MKYLQEIFQDIDGGYSAKRTAFFLFVIAFLVLIAVKMLHALPAASDGFVSLAMDKLQDLIKWVGGFIAGEQATKFAPRGKEGV